MKSDRVNRVIQILTTLQTGKSYCVEDLAKMFDKTRRTIFRDLEQLKAIGVPYHYNTKDKGYRIDPEFFLPPIDLNLQEAMSLLLLTHKGRNNMQLPFKNSALMAALKIENNLPAGIRKYCDTTLRNISTRGTQKAPMKQLDKMFAQLQKAILKKQLVHLNYHSLFDGRDISVELAPYHLIYNKRAWYVLGLSSLHKSPRTFKLNRIKSLEPGRKCFIPDESFDPYDYFGRAWSMIPEGRIHHIKLRFLPKVAGNVSEVDWHSTQRVRWCDDGSAIVEFRVDGLNEISWWILGYGDQVQVLSPKALRKKVVQRARGIIELNQST